MNPMPDGISMILPQEMDRSHFKTSFFVTLSEAKGLKYLKTRDSSLRSE
jgi:hypothetical protein